MYEEGWVCFEKALQFEVRGSEGDQRRRGNASGEGEQECWCGEGGCYESSEMESGSSRDCC